MPPVASHSGMQAINDYGVPSKTLQTPVAQHPPTNSVHQKFLSRPQELGLTLVGFSGGQCKPGTDAAPDALLQAGLLTQLKDDLGYRLHGDVQVRDFNNYQPTITPAGTISDSSAIEGSDPDHRGMKNPRAVSAVTQQISELVYSQAREGRLALTIGGDHSIGIGTVSGVAKAIRERFPEGENNEIALIWVDAHADINTPETSESGNIHGMPVAFLTDLARSNERGIFDWLRNEHKIDLKKLVFIGLRDVDRGEKKILRDNGIKAFSMHDVDRHGIGNIMDQAMEYIGKEIPVHMSFDVDALDPMWAPSTGTPVRGGLTLREGDFICECVAASGQLVGVDLVEVNPQLVGEGVGDTVRAGISLIRCALGDTLL